MYSLPGRSRRASLFLLELLRYMTGTLPVHTQPFMDVNPSWTLSIKDQVTAGTFYRFYISFTIAGKNLHETFIFTVSAG